jgi:hypothetical protein
MLKVPAIIAASIIGFVLGGGAALLGVSIINPGLKLFKTADSEQASAAASDSAGPAGGGMMGPGGGPGGGRGGAGGPGARGSGGGGRGGAGGPGGGRGGGAPGGARGGGGPNSKAQLVALVTKLEQLTSKPLSVNLNEEQQAKLREELKGLNEKDDLSDDEAKKRLDSILEIVKGEKETLEAAGYRWPGQRGGGGGTQPPAEVPNPFKEGDAGKHLKALQEQLSKGKTE